MSEVRVYMRHLRTAKLCATGARAWSERNGLEWKRIRDGIPVSELRGTGCAIAERVCLIAEQEADKRHE